MQFDIIILIETHHKHIDEISQLLHIFKNNFNYIHTEAIKGDPYAGIVVLIRNTIEIAKTSILLAGRLLNFRIKNDNQEYNITALYGYTGKNSSQSKTKFFTTSLQFS